ncbi:ubiquitin carboxyl-terminal hydrolase CYLD [Synchiropus splendidus]|uniref:ubiquitin carboxyl-terminal hydrolase CYLD n=1 Tax=Synchiropus splendidus TaxID=270530 RepID=UPI00237E4278|nr:ubiquitin carboxyl-terminal hydrolase CYLD [Synchiropus splendidus]
MSSDLTFYILIIKPEIPRHLDAGLICYCRTSHVKSRLHSQNTKIRVIPCGASTSLDYNVELTLLEEVSEKVAGLLLALECDSDRLKWFDERKALAWAETISPGHEVAVEHGGGTMHGVVRFVGHLSPPKYPAVIAGIHFGIKLQGDWKHKLVESFQMVFSKKECDVMVPFNKIRPWFPDTPPLSAPSPTTPTEKFEFGDRVTYVDNLEQHHGMVVSVEEHHGTQIARIATDVDENGIMVGELKVPLQFIWKSVVPAEPEKMDLDPPAAELSNSLTVNTMVQISLKDRRVHGIIRWVGKLEGVSDEMAGLELDEDVGVCDGTFKSRRYFVCPDKRGIFVKLSSCSVDSRFQALEDSAHSESMLKDKEQDFNKEPRRLDPVPPVSTEQVDHILVGQMKGIQGHCNSCYMDAALFSLFSCSSALDSMLFKRTEAKDAAIQETLLHDIVNPLRSNGFVKADHIMKLREQLQKHGYSRTFTTEEKDPEEFLTIVMQDILALEPLLKLSAGGKVQESYCYQIFLDQNHSLVLPTVQQLLDFSFQTSGLWLAEVPSCLILQMPRFGKKFKMFEKIFPSLELDVTDLLSDGPMRCVVCGGLAKVECRDCSRDLVFGRAGLRNFCEICTHQVHTHPKRSSHRPTNLDLPQNYLIHGSSSILTRDRLELFAVLCIETSHYVSFIKHGPGIRDWIFFDSMADRKGESDGYNIPEVQRCPEVGVYLEMSPDELANEVPRDMKGVAKRLFCDAYMYLYRSANMCLYR